MQLPHRRRVPGLRGDLSGDLRRATASHPARRRPRPAPRVAAGAVSDPMQLPHRRRAPGLRGDLSGGDLSPGHGEASGSSTRPAGSPGGGGSGFDATSAVVCYPVSGDLRRATVCARSFEATAPQSLTGCSCRTAGAPRTFEATSAAIYARATARRPARRRDRPTPRVAAGAGSRRPALRSPSCIRALISWRWSENYISCHLLTPEYRGRKSRGEISARIRSGSGFKIITTPPSRGGTKSALHRVIPVGFLRTKFERDSRAKITAI